MSDKVTVIRVGDRESGSGPEPKRVNPFEPKSSGGSEPGQPQRPGLTQRLLNFALIFTLTWLAFQLFFAPEKKPAELGNTDDIVLTAEPESAITQPIEITIHNQTAAEVALPGACPDLPIIAEQFRNGRWEQLQPKTVPEHCAGMLTSLAPQSEFQLNIAAWQGAEFATPGKYRFSLPVGEGESARTFSTEIERTQPGFFGRIWDTVFFNPLYNSLIFFIREAGYSFGLGIVALTLLIRIILLVPYQRSMVAQRRLQKLQPQLDAIKKKHAGNQQLIALETMALFRREKVSPFGGILPLLLQMPFLIAVFWIVQSGLSEHNFVRLYSPLADFDFSAVITQFFWLDLTRIDFIVLPIFVAAAQFLQLWLAMNHQKKQQTVQPAPGDMAATMQQVQKMMLYVLPAMVAVFTATLPAAVGLYWAVSTVFGIGQQLLVNRLVK